MDLQRPFVRPRIGMTLETLDVKLHFFSFPGPLRLSAFQTTVFIRWKGGKIFPFKLAGSSCSGDIFYHLHISITPSALLE